MRKPGDATLVPAGVVPSDSGRAPNPFEGEVASVPLPWSSMAIDFDDSLIQPAEPPSDTVKVALEAEPPKRSGRGERTRRLKAAVLNEPPELPETPTLGDLARGSAPRGTLMRFLTDSKLPRPVELKHVSGDHVFDDDGRHKHQGRYVIGQILGRGGMGVVRLVKDLDVGRSVAMKTVNAADPDVASLVQSLVTEAQTTGQLEHPNIVPVYELGALADGTVFYTMRAVSGATLKEVLHRLRNGDATTRQDYSERKLLAIFQQICQALHYAHSRGVVHRDIKPDNIVLGAYGEVHVLDWGIAYVLGRSNDPLARAGLVVGTPHYMAPEQAKGEIHKVDGRTDVFSLGVVLHEILTLSTPVTERGTERALEAVRALSTAPRPALRADGSALPDALADLCARTMAPRVEDRMATAGELAMRVEQYLEGTAERDRRSALATAEFAVGLQAYSSYFTLRSQREALASTLAERARRVHRWDPLPDKRALAEDEARAQLTSLEVSRAFTNTANHLHAVLGLEPEHAHARQCLANLYWSRFEDAERKAEVEDMVYFADLFLRFNDPVRGPLPMGAGRVTVRTFPEGGEISVYDFGASVPDPRTQGGNILGTAPLADVELPMGMYLLVARKEGYRNAQQAVFVRPGVHQKYLLAMPAWAAEEELVGRDGELGLLQYNLQRTVQGRELRRILVTGQDGIGKARLLAAFNAHVDQLDEIVQFFHAECHEHHMLVPYAPIRDALRIRAGVLPDDGTDAVRRRLRSMFLNALEPGLTDAPGLRAPVTSADHARVERVVEALLLIPGLDPEAGPITEPPFECRARIDLALVELMRLLTQVNPTVFYFQSVEYLDDASRRVLHLAPRELAGAPLFILGIGSDPDGKSNWDEHITLAPLGDTPTAAFLRNLLKGPLPLGLHDRIQRSSGGVPWLIVECIKRMVANGELIDLGGRFVLREGLPPAFPMTMLHARRQQLEGLPPPLVQALRVASAVGDTFWVEALETLGVPDAAALCDALVERELIRAMPHSRYRGTRAYTFRSSLFREVVYEAHNQNLEDLHRRIAAWLSDRWTHAGRGAVDVTEVAELARHYEIARDEERACHYFTRLGATAEAVGSVGIARECYLRALSSAPDAAARTAVEERLESNRRLSRVISDP